MDLKGSLKRAAISLAILCRRSMRGSRWDWRTRSSRSRTAVVTASVILSPVRRASSSASLWVSGFLMLSAMGCPSAVSVHHSTSRCFSEFLIQLIVWIDNAYGYDVQAEYEFAEPNSPVGARFDCRLLCV